LAQPEVHTVVLQEDGFYD